MHALAVYFDREQIEYRHFDPANSSQGEKSNQFFGDLVSVIGSGHVLLIEFKALAQKPTLFNKKRALQAWNEQQFQIDLSAEKQDIPIIYCYDIVETLAINKNPQNRQTYPVETLMGVQVSVPSLLPGRYPDHDKHITLFEWIRRERGKPLSSIVKEFIKAVEYVLPQMLRNEVVLVLFSKDIAYEFNAEALPEFLEWVHAQKFSNNTNYNVIKTLQAQLLLPGMEADGPSIPPRP